MRSLTAGIAWAALVVAVGAARPAAAQTERAGLELDGTWQVSDAPARGLGGQLLVSGGEARLPGWSGRLYSDGERVRLILRGGQGAVGALGGQAGGRTLHALLTREGQALAGLGAIRDEASGAITSTSLHLVRAPGPQPAPAAGSQVAGPEAGGDGGGLEGELVALAEERVLAGGGRDVSLPTGSPWLHAGVGVSLAPAPAVRDAALTASRQATAQRLGAAWLRAEVHGTARASFGSTIPLGPVPLTVGIEAGALLRYEVVAPFATGNRSVEALLQSLGSAAQRTYRLPLSSRILSTQEPGCAWAIEGEMTLGFNAGVGIGREITTLGEPVPLTVAGRALGEVGPVVVGANVNASAFLRVRGYLRLEVSLVEQDGARVAVLRVTNGSALQGGAALRVFLGVTNADALRSQVGQFKPMVELLEQATGSGAVDDLFTRVQRVPGLARVQFDLGLDATWLDERELTWRFDLASQAAAYDRAIRGDLSHVPALTTRFAERGVTTRAGVAIGPLEVRRTSQANVRQITILEPDGRETLFRDTSHELDGRKLTIHRTGRVLSRWYERRRPGQAEPEARGRIVHYRFLDENSDTTTEDMRRRGMFLASWGFPRADVEALLATSTARRNVFQRLWRQLRSAESYGTTRMEFALDFSGPGFDRIAASREEDLARRWEGAFQALGRHQPPGCEEAWPIDAFGRGARGDPDEWVGLRETWAKLQTCHRPEREICDGLVRALSEQLKFCPYTAIIALFELAGADNCRFQVSAAVQGSDGRCRPAGPPLAVEHGQRGASFEDPVTPFPR